MRFPKSGGAYVNDDKGELVLAEQPTAPVPPPGAEPPEQDKQAQAASEAPAAEPPLALQTGRASEPGFHPFRADRDR